MNNIGMNDDMLVNNLLGELIGSNEDCLRKASEQIVAHVLHHINENSTGDDGQKMSDAEVHTLVKKYLTNENHSTVPLPISKEVINEIVINFRNTRMKLSRGATQIAFLDMKARHDQAIHRITDLYSDKLESVIREESERLKNNPISEEGQRKLDDQAIRHSVEESLIKLGIEKELRQMERKHKEVMNSLNDEFLGVQNQNKRAMRICEEATELYLSSKRPAKKRG